MRRSNSLTLAAATAPAAPLTVTSVTPANNWPLAATRILGTGFEPDMKVWFGSIRVPVDRTDSTGIEVMSPAAGPGTVDIRVGRRDGQTRTLRGAFTYRLPRIRLSRHELTRGETFTVSWVGPGAVRCWPFDHIGLYPAGVTDTPPLWHVEMDTETGTRQLAAPARPGNYQFCYVAESRYVFARAPITVR